MRTRSFTDAPVGSCPLVIEKATGATHLYGSAPFEYAKYQAWLDGSNPTSP